MVGVVAMRENDGSGDEPNGSGDEPKDSGSDDEPLGSGDDSEPKPESSVRFDHELRRRREAQGMTLEEMAERSGMAPNYIGMIEKGNPSLAALTECEPTSGAMPGEAVKLADLPSSAVREAIITILRAIVKQRRM